MFDYKTIVPDSDMTIHFERVDDTQYCAIDAETGSEVGRVDIENGVFKASDDRVFTQYKLWQTRPERAVGRLVPIEGQNMEQLIDSYEELLVGAHILQSSEPVVAGSPGKYSVALEWIRTTDFYTAPASTHYHDSMPGGLLIHSLKVYNKMLELVKIDTFKNVDIAKATIAALAHDWCKIGYYESYQKNVKNEKTGQWEKETAYKVNQKGIPLGHGATSLYIAARLFSLDVEQALAIRWHMSTWNVSKNEESELQLANQSYPMVHLIQFSDQLAVTDY